MARHSPPESIHAPDPDELRAPEVTFRTARDDGILMGRGALPELTPDLREIRSMCTARPHRVRKVATTLLPFMVDEARCPGHRRLSRDTGSGAPFATAVALYRRFRFPGCGLFGSYREEPFSSSTTPAL
jgi:putative acetyltransferase